MFQWIKNFINFNDTCSDKKLLENEEVIKLEAVFDISDNAFISHSYVSRTIDDDDRKKISLEDKISKLVQRKKIIILHGYTKQGKTVLIKKIFSSQPHIFLEGGAISSINSIWSEINTQANIASSIQIKEGAQQAVSKSSTNTANGVTPIYRQSFQSQLSATATSSADFTETYTLDPKASASKILKQNNLCLIIDDFHFLSNDIQNELVQFSKTVAGSCPVILITTSAHVNALFNFQNELTGRTEYLPLPKWEKEDLRLIAINGFKNLKCNVDKSIIDFIVKHSFLSPFLTQDICYELCVKNGVEDNTKQFTLVMPENKLLFLQSISNRNRIDAYKNILKINNHSINTYETNLPSKDRLDIYGLIREAIASADFFPSIEVSEIKKSVASILQNPSSFKNLDSQIPQSLNTMYQESKRINEETNKQQGKKSDPPLEYIKTDNENKVIFHDPMLALNLVTLTQKYKSL
jgi:hypothetical protein